MYNKMMVAVLLLIAGLKVNWILITEDGKIRDGGIAYIEEDKARIDNYLKNESYILRGSENIIIKHRERSYFVKKMKPYHVEPALSKEFIFVSDEEVAGFPAKRFFELDKKGQKKVELWLSKENPIFPMVKKFIPMLCRKEVAALMLMYGIPLRAYDKNGRGMSVVSIEEIEVLDKIFKIPKNYRKVTSFTN